MNIDIKICEDDEIQLKYIEEKVKIILNDTKTILSDLIVDFPAK